MAARAAARTSATVSGSVPAPGRRGFRKVLCSCVHPVSRTMSPAVSAVTPAPGRISSRPVVGRGCLTRRQDARDPHVDEHLQRVGRVPNSIERAVEYELVSGGHIDERTKLSRIDVPGGRQRPDRDPGGPGSEQAVRIVEHGRQVVGRVLESVVMRPDHHDDRQRRGRDDVLEERQRWRESVVLEIAIQLDPIGPAGDSRPRAPEGGDTGLYQQDMQLSLFVAPRLSSRATVSGCGDTRWTGPFAMSAVVWPRRLTTVTSPPIETR